MVEIGKPIGVTPVSDSPKETMDKTPLDEFDLMNRTREAEEEAQILIKMSKEEGKPANYYHDKKVQANIDRKEVAIDDKINEKLGHSSVFGSILKEKVKDYLDKN